MSVICCQAWHTEASCKIYRIAQGQNAAPFGSAEEME